MIGGWIGVFSLPVAHAQEQRLISINKYGKIVTEAQNNNSEPSINPIVCNNRQKTDCLSQPLLVEELHQEEWALGPQSLQHFVKASFSPIQKEFLTLQIYVDRQHRKFEEEIIEIFDQSINLETQQVGDPIQVECHCDDRESLAYSFILGHRWGKRVKAYLKNLAEHPLDVELTNYGKGVGACTSASDGCQHARQLRTTFRFLAIRESHAGCILGLKLPIRNVQRKVLFEEHPLFLQEIHVAGVTFNPIP